MIIFICKSFENCIFGGLFFDLLVFTVSLSNKQPMIVADHAMESIALGSTLACYIRMLITSKCKALAINLCICSRGQIFLWLKADNSICLQAQLTNCNLLDSFQIWLIGKLQKMIPYTVVIIRTMGDKTKHIFSLQPPKI